MGGGQQHGNYSSEEHKISSHQVKSLDAMREIKPESKYLD